MLFEYKDIKEKKKSVNMAFNESFVEELNARALKMGVPRTVYVKLAIMEFWKKEDKEQN